MYRTDSTASRRLETPVAASASRRAESPARYRSRDFGIGYGASSGYAARRGYAASQLAPRFRLV